MPLIVSSTGCPQVADKAAGFSCPFWDTILYSLLMTFKWNWHKHPKRIACSAQCRVFTVFTASAHTHTHRGSIWVDWRFCSRAKFSLLFTFPHTIQIQQQQQRQQTESDISLVSQSTSDDSRLGILFYYSRQSSWRQIAKKEEFLFKIKCE